MEAAAVSVFQGAMGSLLGKLGDLLADKYKLLKEAKDDIMSLKAELGSMHTFLKKMSDEEELEEQAKCWAKEVRELSYDIEDSVDEFMLRVERESNSTPHGFRGFIHRCWSLATTIRTRHQITEEFKGLKRRVVEVNERRTRYKVDEAVSKPNNTPIDPRMLALYAETAGLVGIDEPREELIRLMMDEEGVPSQQLKVLSIVGFGGLGKTTLANEIYRKLKGQFQCRSLVSVSQKPNVRKILRNILSQVGYVAPKETNMEIWDVDELISKLQEFLMDNRYIIVIDDIWDANHWDIIRCALPENKNGSKVITTTRIETVAAVCCSYHYEHVYKMRPLSNEDSRRLFFLRIFGSEGACPPNLEEVSAEILKRCGGLPLAVITISSLLASQRNKVKEHWEHVRNSLGSNLEVNPTLDGMRQILNLSYISLPHYLKTCMLYLGIYPEDYTINKYDLVRQWVAQGFISKALGQDPEDVAEGYFNELVNRSIIQPVDTDPNDDVLLRTYLNDDVLSCRVHDMMLDLILHKCREENFITAIDDIQDITGLHDKVRRLSLYLDGVIDGTTLGTVQLSQVRALARFGTSTYIPPLLEFKHLRVLVLELPTPVIPDLTGMSHLFQLRYVNIEAHVIVLPSKIRVLQQLEALELRKSNNVEIPSDVVHLRRLLHLIVPRGISLPSGIGNMKSLRTLQGFDLGMNSIENIKDLGDLTNLRVLQIFPVREKQLGDMEARQRMDVLRSSLEKLCNLRYLRMSHDFSLAGCWDELSSLSTSPCLLQRLVIDWCWFSRVPKWIGELHNLYDLELCVEEVLEEDVGILAQLQSLIHLNLHIQGTPKEKVVICGTGFPVLKHFIISCFRISYLAFEAGAMPKLQKLQIRFNAQCWDKYGAPSAGIEHLSGLKEISVSIGGYGAEESSRRAAQSALRNAIDMHPGRPTANITYHDNLQLIYAPVGPLDDDGFSWRKYGQKDILDAKHPRGYYRCTHRHTQGCQATKQVQRTDEDPLLFDVVYHKKHTCAQSAQPQLCPGQEQSSVSVGFMAEGGLQELEPMLPAVSFSCVPEGSETGCVTASPSVSPATSESQVKISDPLQRTASHNKRKELPKWSTRVRVNSVQDAGPLDDGFIWRKYGQKELIHAKHPRDYYRCAHRHTQGCRAAKQVQRTDDDPLLFDITYQRNHTCTPTTRGHDPQQAQSTRRAP